MKQQATCTQVRAAQQQGPQLHALAEPRRHFEQHTPPSKRPPLCFTVGWPVDPVCVATRPICAAQELTRFQSFAGGPQAAAQAC